MLSVEIIRDGIKRTKKKQKVNKKVKFIPTVFVDKFLDAGKIILQKQEIGKWKTS